MREEGKQRPSLDLEHRFRRLAGPAESAYRKALELDKNNPDHYFFLGRFLGRANRLGEALPLLETAVRANPRQKDYVTALDQVRSGVPPP